MKVEQLSCLHTISFTNPRLNPNRDGDFCVYFILESDGPKTFATDLALFIRTLGRELIKWSVLGVPHRLNPGDPAHPVLQDLAYSWDGVTCVSGVLQFSASPISVMNIDRAFRRTSRIVGGLCHAHRYEYFANGIFAAVERAVLLSVFTEMEVAAQCVRHNKLYFTFEFRITHLCSNISGSYVTTMPFSLTPPTVLSVFRIKVCCFFSFFVIKISMCSTYT